MAVVEFLLNDGLRSPLPGIRSALTALLLVFMLRILLPRINDRARRRAEAAEQANKHLLRT